MPGQNAMGRLARAHMVLHRARWPSHRTTARDPGRGCRSGRDNMGYKGPGLRAGGPSETYAHLDYTTTMEMGTRH